MPNSIPTNDPPRPFRLAFTLVELLVVIAIIAILIGVLLPALSKARAAARTTQSISNTHQIAMGLFMYAGDNKQYFPPTAHTGLSWMEAIGLPGFHTPADFATPADYQDYLDRLHRAGRYVQLPQAFRSPNDLYPYWDTPDPNGETRHTSYGINAYLTPDHPPYFGVRTDNVVAASNTVITVEYSVLGAWEDHTTPQWYGYDPAQGNPQSTAMGLADVSNLPYPNDTLYNEALASGAAAGASSNPPTSPTIDFTDDASDAWDPTKFRANSQALDFYRGSDVYGFVDGHSAILPFARTFSWPAYNPSSWIPPAINWYDPKASK